MKTKILGLLAVVLVGPIAVANAAQVGVSYTLSGTAGNWTLDFSVTNNISSKDDALGIYLFGVALPARNITGSPDDWSDDSLVADFDATVDGGTGVYNNNWITFDGASQIGFGSTLSGFRVNVMSPVAPSSVSWFAYGADRMFSSSSVYTGPSSESFGNRVFNPGFEGTVGTAAVPEPGTLALLGLGLAGFGLSRRRKA